jgi:small multidrug resistance pump
VGSVTGRDGMIVLLLAGLTVGGDYFLKLASRQDRMFQNASFIAGACIYAVGAVGWTLAFRHMKMASVGALYSSITIVLLMALGTLVFRERLEMREYVGIGFALASILLLLRHG